MLPQFTDILAIIVIFQLLFIFALLFSYPRGKKLSNRLFAFFFLAMCFNFTDGILVLRNAYVNHPSFAFIGNNFSLLFGPLLFLYVKSVIYRDFRLKKTDAWHAAPFLVFLSFSVASYHLQPPEMKQFILQSAGKQQYPWVLYVISAAIYMQFFCYTYLSLKHINTYRAAIHNSFSETNRINLNWLSSTVIFFSVVIGIGILNTLVTILPVKGYSGVTLSLIIVGIFLFINRVLFKAMRQPEVFGGIKEADANSITIRDEAAARSRDEVIKEAIITRKYAGSVLTETDKVQIKQRIVQHMESNKPYMEPELTLEQLAGQLQLKPKIVSQVINECLEQNFFDFINRYRINEAKRLLTNPADKKITILEVLYEVGFNSKSSFNTLFKKYAGVTPSEFKKKNMYL